MSENISSNSYPLLLLVEDDLSHTELIERAFEGEVEVQYHILYARNLNEASAVIAERTPDLILTDFRLPDGTGNELVGMVHNRCPVIIMTSFGNEHIAVEMMKTGAFDYIIKSPEAFANMPHTVNNAIQSFSLIMAKRKADAATVKAKRDWERTFDAVIDLIALIDADCNIIRANKSICDFFGQANEDIVGKKCCRLVHGVESFPDECHTAKECFTKTVNEKFEIACNRNGQLNYFEVSLSPLFDDNGVLTSYVHVMHDLTERKHAEEEQRKMEYHLQQIQRLESLGVMAGGIAHDFNNILTIILGNCFVLKENIVPEVDRLEHLNMIESAANKASNLCRQMLEYSANHPIQHIQFNLRQLVDDNIRMLSSAIKKNVTINRFLDNNILNVVGDVSQLQQVVMNLVINAAESIGEENGEITVSLHITSINETFNLLDYFAKPLPVGKYAELKVADTGCGIDESVKQKIFEPFFTTKFSGRGLGMSAILGIIKTHNGFIQVNSTPGIGTAFTVYLPLPSGHDGEILDAETKHQVKDEGTNGSPTILLVEDELELLSMAKLLLEAQGFKVLTAKNGKEALEQYDKNKTDIDAVMLDMIMPVMGGIEAYRMLRVDNERLPVIICSGYGAEKISEEINSDPQSCFMQKPYNPNVLRTKLLEMIGT